ncbi:hypothetical protein A2346_05120 [candidate division WOR-1 bacterium RIFOXYB12_FULL_52_16]|nr:MAG: hypothetical protein A2346_05120 [candidate division WOR-1 bacterium RIFOXYB12_FULL_52_16]
MKFIKKTYDNLTAMIIGTTKLKSTGLIRFNLLGSTPSFKASQYLGRIWGIERNFHPVHRGVAILRSLIPEGYLPLRVLLENRKRSNPFSISNSFAVLIQRNLGSLSGPNATEADKLWPEHLPLLKKFLGDIDHDPKRRFESITYDELRALNARCQLEFDKVPRLRLAARENTKATARTIVARIDDLKDIVGTLITEPLVPLRILMLPFEQEVSRGQLLRFIRNTKIEAPEDGLLLDQTEEVITLLLKYQKDKLTYETLKAVNRTVQGAIRDKLSA